MPVYVYSALTSDGDVVSGRATAASAADLRSKLKSDGLLVRNIKKEAAGKLFRSRVSPKDVLRFTNELVVLLHSGLNLLEALKAASEDQSHCGIAMVASDLVHRINDGESLSSACTNHPEVFDALFVSAVRTGEQTGQLERVLENYRDMLEKRVLIRKKVRQALAYPLFLLVAMSGIVGFLLLVVMPRFVALYTDMKEALPLSTRVLLYVVHHLPWATAASALLVFALIVSVRMVIMTRSGRLLIDRFRLKLPIYGDVSRHASCELIGRSLSMLLGTGTPLVPAMGIVGDIVPNTELQSKLRKMGSDVAQGRKLSDALVSSSLFPRLSIRMIAVGEKSGKLEESFAMVADYHQEEVEERLAGLMAVIEPLLILLVGALVGGIIVVMYLPIIHMVEIVK